MKAVYYILIIIISLLTIYGCKKEEPRDILEEEMQVLIGQWEWSHTYHTLEICSPEFTYSVTLNPETQNFKYYILINQNGTIKLYRDEQLVGKHDVFINYFNISDSGNLLFRIDLDNNENQMFSGAYFSDTLFLNQHPFDAKDDGCISYSNYFIRQ